MTETSYCSQYARPGPKARSLCVLEDGHEGRHILGHIVGVDPVEHAPLNNYPELRLLVAASMRERVEALNAIKGRHWEAQEELLACLGAISLWATHGIANVPESLVEVLRYAAIELDTIQMRASRGERDPAEVR